MRFRLVCSLSLALSLVGCVGGPNPAPAINAKAPPGRGLTVQDFRVSDGSTRRVSVFLPFDYDPARQWPAIVFLQGLGEGGTDGVKNTTVGLGPALRKRAQSFGYIVLFPQSGGRWVSDDSHRLAIDVLDEAQRRYNIDPKRVYLTGVSMGGFGTWAIGAKYPDRFAALVPLCAHNGVALAPKLTQTPAWAFHNSGDPFVSASGTRATVKKINALGGNVKMTIFKTLGHNCWDRAYDDDALWEWLGKQRR